MIFCHTGAMMKMVRKSASPITIWLLGSVLVPSARRSRDSTITIRLKEVTMIRMAGASDSTVIIRKICSNTVDRAGSSPGVRPSEK